MFFDIFGSLPFRLPSTCATCTTLPLPTHRARTFVHCAGPVGLAARHRRGSSAILPCITGHRGCCLGSRAAANYPPTPLTGILVTLPHTACHNAWTHLCCLPSRDSPLLLPSTCTALDCLHCTSLLGPSLAAAKISTFVPRPIYSDKRRNPVPYSIPLHTVPATLYA